MTMTRYSLLAASLLLMTIGITGMAFWPSIERLLSPTEPVESGGADDGREESGADPEYPEDLRALAASERELQAIAEEHGLDLLDPDQAADAEAFLALRLSIAELVDHFDGRVNRIVDDWAPGWWEEPATPLPDFSAVHALVDDTSEFDRRELDAMLAGA